MSVIDITKLMPDPPSVDERSHYKMAGGRVMRRDPKTVDGIVLHKTGTLFSVDKKTRDSGDATKIEEALHRRALNVHAHITAFGGEKAGVSCGDAIYAHPLDWYVYHGNGLNARSIGIEIEEEGAAASDRAIQAAKDAVAFAVREGRSMGMPIRYIWGHRQSDGKDRPNDPGEQIWQKVVVEYAVPVLGLEMQPEYVVGDGKPIPKEWGWAAKAAVVAGGGAILLAALGVGGFF